MLYIILTIGFITIIGILFKLFPKYEVDAFQAIVVNYAICVVMATLHSGSFPLDQSAITASWFPFALIMSALFIFGFYFQSIIFKIFGIAVSSIVLKLSLLVTAVFAIIFYQESLPISKSLGLLIALMAIVLVSYPSKDQSHITKVTLVDWVILLISFFISAFVDIGFTYVERSVSTQTADPQFIGTATAFAFIWGIAREGFRIIKGSSTFKKINVIAGVLLGIVNYATFWGMMKSIGSDIDTSIVFTSINIGVIILSLLFAIILFQEKLSKLNLSGVILSIIAVWLISINI